MIKNISDFVSKQTLGRSIEGILVTPDKIVATDSYKLIEIKQASEIKKPTVFNLAKGFKTFETANDTGLIAKYGTVCSNGIQSDAFPDYAQVIPKDTDNPVFEIDLSPEHLEQIAKAFKGTSKYPRMTMKLYAKNKPVVFTNNKDIMALLMPMN
jgi:DNA polymerase III sliding clamp (beta) subunit (PCNA family)